MIVVGLTGKAGAGKSTVADHLVERYGFTRLSFAGPLKKMLRTLDPIIGVSSGEPYRLSELFEIGDEARIKKHPVWGEEYRRLLQVLGTDCIRAVDEGFWVRAAMQQLADPEGRYVFDDVRFPNEASAVCLHGKKSALWHISRPHHDGGGGAHSSEQYAGKMGETSTLLNDGTVDELRNMVGYRMMLLGVPA